MEIIKKRYSYTGAYQLSDDSAIRKFIRINEPVLDDKGHVIFFENHAYKLSAKTDDENKIREIFYESSYDNYIDNDNFNKEALEVITKSINRLQIAFIGIQNKWNQYNSSTKYNQKLSVEIIDNDTGVKPLIVGKFLIESYAYVTVPDPIAVVSLQDIHEVLTVCKDNIDEYIELFLNIENLSVDPVLELIALYTLYEYIKGKKPSDKRLERLFLNCKKVGCNASLEEKFRNTRHLVAHGFAGGKGSKSKENTTKILEEFLGVSPSGEYSFERHNSSHIALINDVVSNSKTIIDKYLREELNRKELALKTPFKYN